MDDEADLQKMIDVLNSNKQTEWDDFNFGELQDTTDSEDSDLENEPNASEMVDDELYDIEANDVVSVYKHDPVSSLKPEEKDLIDHCDDPELKQVLFLNRKKNINLILLYKKLQDLLMECRQYIIEKASLLREHINTLKANNLSSASWKLAAPYFKDKDLYQSPMNDDTKIKMNNHELFIYDFKPNKPWTNFEYEKLIKAVKLNYSFKKHQLKRAVKRENDKQPAGQSCGDTAVEEHVENFETEIPPLNSNDHLDWSRIASVFLQDKHKEFECRSTWHLLLHPSINNSPWTAEESDRLKQIAEKYRFQNWKAIACELGTNRSEFIVCKHFSSNLSEKFKKGEFNYEEDKKLLELVKRYKIGNFIQWNKITSHFRNRTRAQIYHRYCYFLSQDSKKKGKFTKAEDIVLMIYVDKFGRKFANIVKYLPNRSMIQCKSRYANNLERTNQKGNWTLEEDEKVCEHVKTYGSQSWSKLSKELNRSRGQLRQRYIRLKAFMDAEPDADLAKLPRSRRILADTDRYAFCRAIADKYRGVWKIPTVEEIEKKIEDESVDIEVSSCDDYDPNDDEVFLKTPISDEVRQNLRETKETDESLLEFFSNSFKPLPTERISEPELEQGIDDIEGVLNALKANLTIPDDFETTHKDYLDPLDCRILRCLKKRKICAAKTATAAQKLKSVRELIPPSFYSTIGMRSLLIKHLKLECRSKDIYELSSKGRGSFSSIRQNIANDIMACSAKDRKELENERNLFYRRFHSLFKWPALMTLENPSTEILNISDFLPVKKVSTVKRTYSRTAPDVNQQQDVESEVKRSKITSSDSSTVSVNVIKLRPVANESVIKDLMKNKKKKLFSVNKINENGCVKTVISEIKLDFETTKLNFDNAVVLGKNVAASTSVVSAVEQAGVSIDDNRRESTSSSASSSTSSAIKDLPLVVIKSDIDGNSEILDSVVNLENSSEASTSKHLPIVSKKTRSSSKAIKDLPLVVIKSDIDGNSEILGSGVNLENSSEASTSKHLPILPKKTRSSSKAIKDLPLVVIKSDIDANSEILGSGVNLENSSEASTSKHLPIVSKIEKSSSKAIKDLPLVVIKGDFDGNSQMLELSSRGQFRNSFDTCNSVAIDTKDSVSMEMLPKEGNGECSNQFNGTEDANNSRDNEDEDKRDVEKLNMFLREYSEDSDGDSDIDISDFNSDHDSDIDISDFNVMV